MISAVSPSRSVPSKRELWRRIWGHFVGLPLLSRLFIALRFVILPAGAIISAIPQPARRILDLGCGYGLVSAIVVETTDADIDAIDLDAQRITAMQGRLGGRVRFRVQDLADPSFDDRYDVVLSVDLFHHLPKTAQEPLIDLIYSRLAPGGLLVFKDIDTRPRYKFAWNWIHDKIVAGGELNFRPSKDYAALFRGRGFSVEPHPVKSVFPYPHYLLLCAKPLDS